MNQKELMLQGHSAKAKTHTITVGYYSFTSVSGPSVHYGFLKNANTGLLTPADLFGVEIVQLSRTYNPDDGSLDSTVMSLTSEISGFTSIQVTRLDTLKSLNVPSKGGGSYTVFTKDGLFSSADVGKTIDLIIEPA